MTADTEGHLLVRLFVGAPVAAQWRQLIEKSALWQRVRATPDSGDLSLVHHDGRDFFGIFLSASRVPLDEVKAATNHVQEKIYQYFPDLTGKNLGIVIFPQYFVM